MTQGQAELHELNARNDALLGAKQEAVEELQNLHLHLADLQWQSCTALLC